jgi:hypothetical protein
MPAEKVDPRAERAPSRSSQAAVWLWRLANTALLGLAVWVLWRQSLELETLNRQLLDLLDYLNVIAERLG